MAKKEIISKGSCFSDLGSLAWNALKGRWLSAIGAILAVMAINFLASLILMCIPVVNCFYGILLYPLNVGLTLFFLHLSRSPQTPEMDLIFQPCKQYFRFIWGNIRPGIFVLPWLP